MEHRETVSKKRKEISRAYHPYDPLTGARRDSSSVGSQLKESFAQIRKETEHLSDRCKEPIEKAWRVTAKMTATIAFFFYMIESLVNKMDLSDDQRKLMHNRLIPGFYLQKIAQKEKNSERKGKIRQKLQELLSALKDKIGPLSEFDDCEIDSMIRTAKECAGLFQRSSSCVEGRNAQLSLHHHRMHRLSDRKMKGFTVIHNYHLKRPDGTTAAERFFETLLLGSCLCGLFLSGVLLFPVERSIFDVRFKSKFRVWVSNAPDADIKQISRQNKIVKLFFITALFFSLNLNCRRNIL